MVVFENDGCIPIIDQIKKLITILKSNLKTRFFHSTSLNGAAKRKIRNFENHRENTKFPSFLPFIIFKDEEFFFV